jgi:hypothetical protein
MLGPSLAAQRSWCTQAAKEHTMFELDTMNPDVKQAEVAYRREQLTNPHRVTPSRRWLRLRARRTTTPHAR